jgi:FixJ family two-component response regulator
VWTAKFDSMQGKEGIKLKPLVLVVDDSASVRRSTQRLVRSFGFRAEGFASAEELLKSKAVSQASCVILDLRLPDINGLKLQKNLTQIYPGLPVIFLTACGTREEQKQAIKAGAIAFLQKPVSREQMLDAIHAGIERKSSTDRMNTEGSKHRHDLEQPGE